MNQIFSTRLKEVRKEKGWTQKTVAESLGIGQTTVANYENGTRLPDLDKLKEIGDLFGVSVDYLLGRAVTAPAAESVPEHPAQPIGFDDYMSSLLRCDKPRIRTIISSLLDQGLSTQAIHEQWISRSLKEVGRLWDRGELPVWKEHFISEITLENLTLIKSRRIQERSGSRLILAIVPGAELHTIGIRMITDRLEEEGYRILFLGHNIPTDSILEAIRENKPYAVLFSVTMSPHIDSVKLIIEKVKQTFGTRTPTMLIGGAAFDRLKQVENFTGADKYCKTFDDILRNLRRI